MNIIFISPNYPAGHRRYVAALRQAGHNVLGIGDAGEETFAPELRGSLGTYYRVGDLHDYDSVYRACCYYAWQFGRIDGVESLNPYWCDLVSALKKEFCSAPAAPGTEYSDLRNIGLGASALTARVRSSSAKKVCAFAAEHGYPLWAVPAGNKHLSARLIVADAGVKSLLRGSTKDEYVFAVSPEGEELTVDGLMLGGQLVACGAHKWSEDGQSVTAVAAKGLEAQCAAAAEQCGYTDGFFHIRAIQLTSAAAGLGKRGTVCLVTFEPVPPHEYIIDLLSVETDCDLRRSWAEKRVTALERTPFIGWSDSTGDDDETAQTDAAEPETPVLPLERKLLGALACRSFERSYRNLHEKVLGKLAAGLIAHGRTEEPDRFEFSDYVYLFGGSTAAELRNGVTFIVEDHPLPSRTETADKAPAGKSASGRALRKKPAEEHKD